MAKKETRPCAVCGKPITRRLSQVRPDVEWTCSHSHSAKLNMQKRLAGQGAPTKPRTGDYINCTVCGKEFYRQPAYIKQGRHLCSRKCNQEWQGRNQIAKTCPQCGEEFKVSQSQASRTFCSKACEGESLIKRPAGYDHNGRAAIVNYQGYVTVYEPDHPNASATGRVLEHRLVMEQHLGRILVTREHVHHLNGDKQDNRPENLQLLNPTEHSQETARRKRRKLQSMKDRLAEYERRFGLLED